MTLRKPGNLGVESWVDQLVNKARREGAFDALEGRGEPLKQVHRNTDPDWWVKQMIRREKLDTLLPDTLSLKRDVARFLEDVHTIGSEEQVRGCVKALNERIVHVNARPAMGPPSTVVTLRVEKVLHTWRSRRSPVPAPTRRAG